MATSASALMRAQTFCVSCLRGSRRFVRRYRAFLLDPGTVFTLVSLLLLLAAIIQQPSGLNEVSHASTPLYLAAALVGSVYIGVSRETSKSGHSSSMRASVEGAAPGKGASHHVRSRRTRAVRRAADTCAQVCTPGVLEQARCGLVCTRNTLSVELWPLLLVSRLTPIWPCSKSRATASVIAPASNRCSSSFASGSSRSRVSYDATRPVGSRSKPRKS